MSADDTVEGTLADACGTGSCGDCAFGCLTSPTVCGNDGGSASAEDRTTLASSGVAVALLAGALALTGGGAVVAALAGVTSVAGVALAVLGGLALRRGGALGDRLTAAGTRILPHATALLLVTLLARVATYLLA